MQWRKYLVPNYFIRGKADSLKKFFLYVLFALIVPFDVFAAELEVASKVEKYYKTTVVNSGISNYAETDSIHYLTTTEEITEEEYNSFDENSIVPLSLYGYVETNYKKLTIEILKDASKFRYQATLDWKTIPKVRSYDTIAIGHYASVKASGTAFFKQRYCATNGVCKTSSTYYPQTFVSGSSATFHLPTGDLTSLIQTFYFDIEKAVDETIIRQVVTADYAHAVKTVKITDAIKLSVSNAGIKLDNSIQDSYDEISPAEATWTGSW